MLESGQGANSQEASAPRTAVLRDVHFGSACQWASARAIFPERVARVASFEEAFGKTIDRDVDVETKAGWGTAYLETGNAALVAEAKDENWAGPIFVGNASTLPVGAFRGDSCSPE